MAPRNRFSLAVAASLMLAAEPFAALAQPPVWMYPSASENGRSLQELFEHPEGWRQTRAGIAGIGYADHWLNSQFDDAQLRAWLPQIARWGLKLGLEVGAVKPNSPTGQHAFDVHHKQWDRFIADGARIDNIAMDEPYAATVNNLHLPMQYGVEQTADFVALVRRAYPAMSVGDIEPYPYFQPAQVLEWVDAVQARLRQMGAKELDFLRLDVDWMHFRPGDAKGRLGWQGVRMIEDGCHRRGLRFSLIYWAADYPSQYHAGQQTDSTWTEGILDERARYAATGASPDEMIVESWLMSDQAPVPEHAIPESNDNTLSGSVLALKK